jgi:hypothetical protein
MEIRDFLGIIGASIAIGGFLFGIYQYVLAQRWKRLEYAADLLQRLTTDPDLVLALTFLEYSKRKVPLPQKYQSLTQENLFDHDSNRLSQVLKVGYWEDTPEYFIYRDVMNRLFHYLQQIYSFIEMKLIEPGDVLLVEWVLVWIADPRFIKETVLLDYVGKNFPDVRKLMNMFE